MGIICQWEHRGVKNIPKSWVGNAPKNVKPEGGGGNHGNLIADTAP